MTINSDLDDLTVAMVAKNAENTIEVALQSALQAGMKQLVLIDSSETTGLKDKAMALLSGRCALDYRALPADTPVGAARDLAVRQIKTPFGAWLDADDAVAPTYLQDQARMLRQGDNDLVIPAVTVKDSALKTIIRVANIPFENAFPKTLCLNFERNWFPALTFGFRTSVIQGLGYNPSLRGAEDYDALLRSINGGLRIGYLSSPGYIYRDTEGSLSRDLVGRQQDDKRIAQAWLAEPDFDQWLVHHAGAPLARFLSLSLAIKAEDAGRLARWADGPETTVGADDLHPIYALSLMGMTHFLIGTYRLQSGASALSAFEAAIEFGQHSALMNNYALAKILEQDDFTAAEKILQAVITDRPVYNDARQNLALCQKRSSDRSAYAPTRLPMRPMVTRDSY